MGNKPQKKYDPLDIKVDVQQWTKHLAHNVRQSKQKEQVDMK